VRKRLIGLGVVLVIAVVGLMLWLEPGQGDGPPADEPLGDVGVEGADGIPDFSTLTVPDGATTGEVYGRVLGTVPPGPVASVKVWVASDDTRTALTDEKGGFRFKGLPPGEILLRAEVDGRRAERTVFIVEGGITGSIDLVLGEACVLTLAFVTGEGREPVSGLEVAAYRGNETHRAVTDEHGKVVLGLSREIWKLTLDDETYGIRDFTFDLTGKESRKVRIPLEVAGTFLGRVVDREGEPMVGVPVEVGSGKKSRTVETNEDGYWYVSGLPLDSAYSIIAGRYPNQREVEDVRFAHGKKRRRIDLALDKVEQRQLPPHVPIEVTVLDTWRRPIAGAVLFPDIDDRVVMGRTDSNGKAHFNITPSPDGDPFWINVRAEGWVTTKSERIMPDALPEQVEIVMERGVALSGRVTDADGKPLEDVWIHVHPNYRIVKTDENGAFRIEDLVSKSRLSFTEKGYFDQRFELHDIDISRPLEIVLQREIGVRCRVVEAVTGEPIPRFRFEAKVAEVSSLGNTSYRIFRDSVDSSDGTFEIEHMSKGSARLSIWAEGWGMEIFDQIYAREEPWLLRVARDEIRIAGKILGTDGTPIAGFPLELHAVDTSGNDLPMQRRWPTDKGYLGHFETVTDETGAFSFENLPQAFDLTLCGYRPGLSPLLLFDLEGRQDPEGLEVTVSQGSKLKFEIDRNRYPELNNVSLTHQSGHKLERPLLDAERLFEVDGLYEGTWTVLLIERGNGFMRTGPFLAIDLDPGETGHLRFGFEALYSVSGKAMYEDGRPAAGKRMVVSRIEDILRSTIVGDDGAYRFDNLPAGRYQILLSDHPADMKTAYDVPRKHPNLRRLDIGEEDVARDFRFQPVGDVTGRIVADDYSSLSVALRAPDARFNTIGLEADGRFRIPEPGNGAHTLLLSGFLEGDFLHLTSFTMPEDGSDLDLGVLEPEGYAFLEVSRLSQVPLGTIEMFSLPSHIPFMGQPNGAMTYDLPPTPKTMRIPAGPRRFAIVLGPKGYRALPSVIETDLQPGQTALVAMDVQPITRLVVRADKVIRPKRVVLTGEDGTTYIAAEPFQRNRPEPDGSPQVWMGFFAAFFECLPEGLYRLEATSRENRLEKEVDLVKGKPLLIDMSNKPE